MIYFMKVNFIEDNCNIVNCGKINMEYDLSMLDFAIKNNGTLSGEHGIGTHKRKYLDKALNKNAHNLMKEIKNLLDKKNILNPNKSI